MGPRTGTNTAAMPSTDDPLPRRGAPRRWTLATALALSHGVLALALVAMFSLEVVSLRRIDRFLRELREDELGALAEEEILHRAMWAVEVAMRHASDACDAGAPRSALTRPLTAVVRELQDKDRHVGLHVGAEMRRMGSGYESVALEALAGDTCALLRAPAHRTRRLRLDEQLTELWIERSFTLHREIAQREASARATEQGSLALSGLLAAVILVVGAGLARWLARSIARPLARIAADATRLGRGDFSPIAPVDNPAEVAELAEELERMRHALAALDSLKQGFVASVSHELRTPLAKIREALALLEDGAAGELAPRQRGLVGIARRACESQIGLVSNLLDLSRLRAGSVVQMHAEGSVADVAREAVHVEHDDAARRGVRVSFDPGDAHGVRPMDAALMVRAVSNLVRNAVAASPDGAEVRVRCARAEAPGDDIARRAEKGAQWVRVRVEDDGPGVPEAVRSRLFEPFVTVPTEGGAAKVGVGLGLALAREVARAHGGDARSVEAPAGERGARFELWIPLPP